MARVPSWQRRYSRKLLWTDVAVVVIVVTVSQWIRIDQSIASFDWENPSHVERIQYYTLISFFLAYGWLLALVIFDTRDMRVFATGPDEYKRVINATLTTFGVFAIVLFAANSTIGRGHLFIAFPVGIFLLLTGRWAWRKRLQARRKAGKNLYRTIVVGETSKCAHTARQLRLNKIAGFNVLGAVTTLDGEKEVAPGIPVLGGLDDLMSVIDTHDSDAVILTSADALTPERVRQIGWQLGTKRVDLIVAASLTDIAGPRIHTRPVSGFPLIHVESPEFNGKRYLTKRVFDIVGAGLAMLILSPLFLITYVSIKQ